MIQMKCALSASLSTRMAVLILSLTLFSAIALQGPSALAQPPRKAVILSINDVYQIEGVSGGRSGGLARVRALRAELEKATPDLLFLHAGDFLSPSFIGRMFSGAQMIDLMNLMDGNPAAGSLDGRMFVAFGNHEFDATNCNRAGPLSKLVTASEFNWLAANLDFAKCERLSALKSSPKISANQIRDSGGLKMGLFGLTVANPDYAPIVADPVKVACEQVEDLRRRGADVVVALTHLPFGTDLELLGRRPDGRELESRRCNSAPDLVIGGHDHDNMALPSAAPRLFKADADAQSAWVVEIEKSSDELRITGRLVRLDEKRVPDPLIHRITNHWLKLHDERYCLNDCVTKSQPSARAACLKAVEDGTCLKESYVKAASMIETEEITNRSFETGFGNWLADQIRSAGNTDVAFINSGSIRINQDLPAGTVLTRRHLEMIFPFRSKLVVREVAGRDLWRAMEHSVTKRGEGAWAHFSGMAVQLAAPGSINKIARIKVRRAEGSVVDIAPDSTATFKIASIAFVLANGDGHGFTACAAGETVAQCSDTIDAAPAWPLEGEGADIGGLVRVRLRALDQQRGLVATVDRRLCDRGQQDCLIAKW